MPRAGRVFFDGAIYHVYNRLARGERAFADESIADAFADLLQKVMARDGVRVFAWALLHRCQDRNFRHSCRFILK